MPRFKALTVNCPYATMHDDICTIAADKHTVMIVLPFEKLQTVSGGMESNLTTIQSTRASSSTHPAPLPCLSTVVSAPESLPKMPAFTLQNVLSYCSSAALMTVRHLHVWRMTEHPSISLTIVRFVPGDEASMRPSP